jgi:hypothetical protein
LRDYQAAFFFRFLRGSQLRGIEMPDENTDLEESTGTEVQEQAAQSEKKKGGNKKLKKSILLLCDAIESSTMTDSGRTSILEKVRDLNS